MLRGVHCPLSSLVFVLFRLHHRASFNPPAKNRGAVLFCAPAGYSQHLAFGGAEGSGGGSGGGGSCSGGGGGGGLQ